MACQKVGKQGKGHWYKVYASNLWKTLYNISLMPLDYFLVILGCSVISQWVYSHFIRMTVKQCNITQILKCNSTILLKTHPF